MAHRLLCKEERLSEELPLDCALPDHDVSDDVDCIDLDENGFAVFPDTVLS
jgi:hypothetical protein